jgi:hypothetical protein
VANLLLARAETRQREFAVLTALGAGRGRLLCKAMTESIILSVAGGALGVLLARVAVEALVRAYPASLPRIGEIAVDPRVMLVSFAVADACGLLFGLVPMMYRCSDATVETLSIPVLQGRGFQSTDVGSKAMVAVVNETLANTYWRRRNPIGQRFRPCCGDRGNPWFRVIGVAKAKDAKQGGVDQPAGSEVYLLVYRSRPTPRRPGSRSLRR